MQSTRRQLLRSAALLGGSFAFSRAVLACASNTFGDGDGVASSEDAIVTCGPAAISANHGHQLVIPAADVTAAAARTYSIKGTSGHDHTVTVTAAQFAQLGAGRTLTVASTNGAGHTHSVTVTCVAIAPPAASCGTGANATAISGNHGHALTVPAADIAAAVAKTYAIKGTSSHDHQVSMNEAQFATLKTGASLTLTSSSVFSHVHTVTVACG